MEPFTVDRIEIIRGPETLLYSPVTIGGMVNTRKESIPASLPQKVTGTFGSYGETARPGGLGAFTVSVPAGNYALYGETTWKHTRDERTPAGILDNTALTNNTYVLGASRIFENGHAGLSIDTFDSQYGIPGGFIGGHPNGVDIDMLRRSIRFSSSCEPTDRSLQRIDLDLDRTYYNHIEYESGGHIGAGIPPKELHRKINTDLQYFFR